MIYELRTTYHLFCRKRLRKTHRGSSGSESELDMEAVTSDEDFITDSDDNPDWANEKDREWKGDRRRCGEFLIAP